MSRSQPVPAIASTSSHITRSAKRSLRVPSTSFHRTFGHEVSPRFSSTSSAASQPRSSVHASEIAHFSRLSAHWWDQHGEFGLLHAMNPVRIQFMREKLREVRQWEQAKRDVQLGGKSNQETESTRFLEGLTVLDVGCGGGLLSESLTRLGAKTLGLDASSANIGIASTHAASDPELAHLLESDEGGAGPALQYRCDTAEKLVEEQSSAGAQHGSYDVVCAMEVIEHVNEPDEFLRSLAKLVKPGGHLFLSTISRTALSRFLTITMAEQVLRLVTPGTHTHAQYITPTELVNFFRDDLRWLDGVGSAGTPQRVVFETRGVAYLPWKGAWELASRNAGGWSQQCNYLFWARKPE